MFYVTKILKDFQFTIVFELVNVKIFFFHFLLF